MPIMQIEIAPPTANILSRPPFSCLRNGTQPTLPSPESVIDLPNQQLYKT